MAKRILYRRLGCIQILRKRCSNSNISTIDTCSSFTVFLSDFGTERCFVKCIILYNSWKISLISKDRSVQRLSVTLSFMKIRKNQGLTIEPRGTPALTYSRSAPRLNLRSLTQRTNISLVFFPTSKAFGNS